MTAPDGTINEVLDYVRGSDDVEAPADGWQDRALEAIAAEQTKGDGARPTLIAKLEAALASAGPLVDEPTPPELDDAPADEEIVAEAPADDGDGTAWYSHNGQQFHVTRGGEPEKRLLAENATRIPAPE